MVSLNGDVFSGGVVKERYVLYEYCIFFILCIFIFCNISNFGFGCFIDSSFLCNIEVLKSIRNLKLRKRLLRILICLSDYFLYILFLCEFWVFDFYFYGFYYFEI